MAKDNGFRKRIEVLEAQIREYDAQGRMVKKALAEAELEMVREEIRLHNKKVRGEVAATAPKTEEKTSKPSFTTAPQSDIIESKVATTTQEKKGNGGIQMAKKETAPVQEVAIVNVKDLATEYGIEPRALRILLRANGHRAPEVKDAQGFGPRAKYEWPADSKDLAAIRKLIEANLEDEDEDEAEEVEVVEEPKPAKKAKK